jgi:SNF2 family DNA or RNA helicase
MSMTQKGNNLNKFQSDPSISVFLLSLRSGAVGLTLTAANHLFLLDPSFNKGTEMQAINRIYRIGQTRETTITHMVVKNTIEEKIYKRNLTIHTTEQENTHIGHKENASTTELMTLFA